MRETSTICSRGGVTNIKAMRIRTMEKTNNNGTSEVIDDVVDDTVSKIGCGICDTGRLVS
jgi:hypothetical protein